MYTEFFALYICCLFNVFTIFLLKTLFSLLLGSKIGFREEGELWSAYVVTPVMKRNQSEKLSSESVFIDSSSSCDVSQSNVTVMSTVTKAGAVPIGILIHSHQSYESYKQAFSLFRDECPRAFGGEEVSIFFFF